MARELALMLQQNTHTDSHKGPVKNSPKGNGQSSALLPTEHFVPPERKHTDLSQQLSANTTASLPLLYSSATSLSLQLNALLHPAALSRFGNLGCLC